MKINQSLQVIFLQISAFSICVHSLAIRNFKDLNITVDCTDLERMDLEALSMTSYGDRSNSKPLTATEVSTELCPKLRKSSNIVKFYTKSCFKPFPRQIIGLLVRGNQRVLKKMCDSNEERQLFATHSQCLKNYDPENVHKCMDKYIISVESVRDNVHDLDLKLPYSCCSFWEFKKVRIFCSIRTLFVL